MDKIKITKEQHEALYTFTRRHEKDPTERLQYFIDHKYSWSNTYKSLKDFTIGEMSLLLCGHYELETPCPIKEYLMSTRGEVKLLKGDKFVCKDDHPYTIQFDGDYFFKEWLLKGKFKSFYPIEHAIHTH